MPVSTKPRKKYRPLAEAAAKFCKIPQDINCIPSGVYRLNKIDGYCFEFSVGEKIAFVVGTSDRSLFESVSKDEAHGQLTTPEDFTRRYYDLIDKQSGHMPRFNPSEPFTLCFMHPSLARELH